MAGRLDNAGFQKIRGIVSGALARKGDKAKFRRYLDFLRKSQWRPAEWHREYQKSQLRSLIDYSAEVVPYYRRLFKTVGVDPASVVEPEDLRAVPILSRSDLERNILEIIPESIGDESERAGSAIKGSFPISNTAMIMEEAFFIRHLENTGYKPGSPCIFLLNDFPGTGEDTYRYDRSRNRHYYSIASLNQKNLEAFFKKMKSSGAVYIYGYPSALEILADHTLTWEIDLKFQAVVTSGEILTNAVRGKIEQAFETKIYDLYNLSFPVIGMGQCHYCDGYHLFSEYGILELIDFDGNPVGVNDRVGRIVGTNFTNRAMPLIRYDTGDLGIYGNETCDCGRGLPRLIKKLPGRKDNLLISQDGRYIPPGFFQTLFSETGVPSAMYQLIQRSRENFKLRMVRGPEYDENIVAALKIRLLEHIGEKSLIDVEWVEKIESTDGKARSVIRTFEPDKLRGANRGERVAV